MTNIGDYRDLRKMKQEKFNSNTILSPIVWLMTFFICLIHSASAQKPIEYDKIKAFNIVVNYTDCTVKTQMLKDTKKIEAKEDYVYHWYTSNKIMNTKGGYDGKLLHGYYKCFYLNSNLKESGSFKYGVKTGEWRNWAEDGKLKEIVNWKKGKKNGKYKLFNPVGDLIAESNFKDDKLNGKFKTYSSGKLIETLKYKNGELVVKKQKTPKQVKEKKVKEPKVKKEKDTSKNSEEVKKPDTKKKKEPKKQKEPKSGKEKKKKDIQKKDAQKQNNPAN